MPGTTTACAAALNNLAEAISVPGGPLAGELAAVKKAFNVESEEAAQESKKQLAGVLLAEGEGGPWAFTKVKNHWRASQGGHTLAVYAEGQGHKRLDEAAFLEQFKWYSDAIFTVEGAAGREASNLKVGELLTVARPILPAVGAKFEEVAIKIGDNDERTVGIADFLRMTGIAMKPTAGREAPANTVLVRVLDPLIQPEAAEQTVVARDLFVGAADAAIEGYMVKLGVISAEGDVKAGEPALWLASWMARPELKGVIASGLAEAQAEIDAGVAPVDATKMEAIKHMRYFIDQCKSVLRGFTPDDVEAVLGKMTGLGPLARDAATCAALTRAAAIVVERARAQSLEDRVDEAKQSPSKLAAVYRQRADDIEKKHPKRIDVDLANGGSTVLYAFKVLIPASEPDANGKRVVEALGGMPLVKMVADMRERTVVQTTITDMVVTSFANDWTFLLAMAKRGSRWLIDPKPPFDWEAQAAHWNEATDRLGYALDMATSSGLPLSIREAGDASTYRGLPESTSRRAALREAESTVFKPPYNSTYKLAVAKGGEAQHAIPVHICIRLSSEALILSVHAQHNEWEDKTAQSIAVGKPITISAVARLQFLVKVHPYGGYLRSQILSCDKAAMEMPGKGEVVAYAYHLKARVLLIITQVYEDLLGLAESARQRVRLGEAAKAWFSGGLKYEDFFELGGAVSPDDEDNMHGGRLGSTDGPTWQADHERACKEQATIGGMVWGDICGAAKLGDKGRYVFNWV